MDGWRKPKRKAVDPPATFEAPALETRDDSRDRRGFETATRGDALPAGTAPPEPSPFANGDLAPMLARLREDLEFLKRFFAASAGVIFWRLGSRRSRRCMKLSQEWTDASAPSSARSLSSKAS